MSTIEWMASENIAELPVVAAAKNLVTAINAFPARAAKITFFEEELAMCHYLISKNLHR